MNKIEFLNWYIQQAKFPNDASVLEFIDNNIIVKCDCGEQGCKGYAFVKDDRESILEYYN